LALVASLIIDHADDLRGDDWPRQAELDEPARTGADGGTAAAAAPTAAAPDGTTIAVASVLGERPSTGQPSLGPPA
jgi:hypothetical protein